MVSYLEFLQREASSSTSAAVVFESRALNDRSESVDGSGGYTSSFGDTCISATVFSAGLLEVDLHTSLPVLVEVCVRDDIVVLDRLRTGLLVVCS
jgi:hypothetical protein